MTASFALASTRYVEFPFSIQAGMLAMMFVYIGTLVKKYQLINVLFTISPTTKVLVCCFWLIVSACTGGVDIGSSSIGFSILGLLNSLFGFFITIGICIRFKLRFEWIGRNTIYILAGHILVYQYLSALGWHASILPFYPPINWVLENIINISLSLIVGYILSKIKIIRYPW